RFPPYYCRARVRERAGLETRCRHGRPPHGLGCELDKRSQFRVTALFSSRLQLICRGLSRQFVRSCASLSIIGSVEAGCVNLRAAGDPKVLTNKTKMAADGRGGTRIRLLRQAGLLLAADSAY